MAYLYEHIARHVQLLAQPVVGCRVPSARERELYDGIDRELARIRAEQALRESR